MKTTRRTFFRWLTSVTAGLTLSPRPAAPAPQPAGAALDPNLLLALGRAVLPAELGTSATDRVVSAFAAWVAEYRPETELDHDYGTSEIDYTPAHPAPRWARQLQALEQESRRQKGKPFASLSEQERRERIRAQVKDVPERGFPSPAKAEHVAVGLLAFFSATPEATDLCYQAEIGKDTCRDLDLSSAKPAPLRKA